MKTSKMNAAEEIKRIETMKNYESLAYEQGFQYIAGIDEVGRGPLAGPVTAAAVILPRDFFLEGVNDSKLLSEKKRLALAKEIKQGALSWAVVHISPAVIDQINILQATRRAMRIATLELMPAADFLLIDAVQIPDIKTKQLPLIKGDQRSISIACASIVAKVERDRSMQAYDALYPGYGFAKHKGYGTREHMTALREKGPCAIHRRTFEPVRSLIGGLDGFEPDLFK